MSCKWSRERTFGKWQAFVFTYKWAYGHKKLRQRRQSWAIKMYYLMLSKHYNLLFNKIEYYTYFAQGWLKMEPLSKESVYIQVMMPCTSTFLKYHFIDWQRLVFENIQTWKKVIKSKQFVNGLNERSKFHFNCNWWLIFVSWERRVAATL